MTGPNIFYCTKDKDSQVDSKTLMTYKSLVGTFVCFYIELKVLSFVNESQKLKSTYFGCMSHIKNCPTKGNKLYIHYYQRLLLVEK